MTSPLTIKDAIARWLHEAQHGDHGFHRNTWMEDSYIQIYMRVARRFIAGKTVTTLDLANIQVYEQHQGKGIFTEVLGHIEGLNPFDGVFVENVLTERFAKFFQKRGYVNVGYNGPPCFWLPKPIMSARKVA